MPDKHLHKILNIIMILMILILAYLLPKVCLRKVEEGRQRTGGQTADTGETQQSRTGQEAASETEIPDGSGENTQSGDRGLIIIDPGHGGSDPGMVGVGGIEEKIINLQVSQRLGSRLQEMGFQVEYTRSDDRGLYDADAANKKAQDMQRRCALIEEKKPLFTVSIHQNSYTDSSVYGPQVFYYEHSAEGKELAACIQDQMNSQLQIAKPRVIKGNTNYYILKRSEGVTVLVECSFLSNPQEAEKIQTEEYQEAVAAAICSGIEQYLGYGSDTK